MDSRGFLHKPNQLLLKRSLWLDAHDNIDRSQCQMPQYEISTYHDVEHKKDIQFCRPTVAPSHTGAAQDKIRVIDIPNEWRQTTIPTAEVKADSSDLPDELPQTASPDKNFIISVFCWDYSNPKEQHQQEELVKFVTRQLVSMVKTEGSLLTFHGTHKTAAFTMLGDAIKDHMEASVIAVKSQPPTKHDNRSSTAEPSGSSSSVKGKANKTGEEKTYETLKHLKENEWIEKLIICDDIIEVGDKGDQRNDKWLFECTVIISGDAKKVMTVIENSVEKDRPVFLVKGLGGDVDTLVSKIKDKRNDNNDGDREGHLPHYSEGDNLSQTSEDISLFEYSNVLWYEEDDYGYENDASSDPLHLLNIEDSELSDINEDSELSDSFEDSYFQQAYENNLLQRNRGDDDFIPSYLYEGSSDQQISEDSNSLQISEDSNSLQIFGDNNPEHFSGDNNPEHFSGDNNPEQISGDNNPKQISGDNNPEHFSGENNPEQISGDNNPEQISGDNNPEQISGDNSPEQISGDNNPKKTSEDKNKLAETFVDKIAKMKKLHMLHVYDLDASTVKRLSSESELGLEDITTKKSMRWEILTAAVVRMFKGDPRDLKRCRNPLLKMCIEFNAFDLAKEKKLLPEKPEDLEKETLEKAFQWRRVDFIKYFLEKELDEDKKIEDKKTKEKETLAKAFQWSREDFIKYLLEKELDEDKRTEDKKFKNKKVDEKEIEDKKVKEREALVDAFQWKQVDFFKYFLEKELSELSEDRNIEDNQIEEEKRKIAEACEWKREDFIKYFLKKVLDEDNYFIHKKEKVKLLESALKSRRLDFIEFFLKAEIDDDKKIEEKEVLTKAFQWRLRDFIRYFLEKHLDENKNTEDNKTEEKKNEGKKIKDKARETLAEAFQWRQVDFIKYFLEKELDEDKKIEEKKKGEERKIQEKKISGQDIKTWYKKARKKTDDQALEKDLKDLIPSFIFTEKGTKKENMSRRNIFILTLLIEKPEILDMEWLFKLDQFRSKEAAALFACGLLKAIATKKGEYWLHYETYIKKSGEFGKMAQKIISGYYERSPSKTYLFLRQRLPAWGNMSLVQMAMETRNTSFLSLEPCQKVLEIVWIWGNAADAEIFKQKKDASHEVYAGLNKKMLSSLLPPRVMYFFDLLGLILFLMAFAFLIVSSLETGRFHFLEWILLITVITFCMQEVKQLVQLYTKHQSLEQGKDASKTANISEILWRAFLTYFEDYFNIVDFSSILIYVFAFIARVVAYYHPANTKYMDAARVLFSVNFAVFTLRLLRFCYISKSLGPVVHMIGQMVKILVKFLVILTIFIVAYAVASEALLYPESKMSWALVFHLLRKPYWSMYGELFLDELEADESDTCTQCTTDPNLYKEYDQLRCVSQTGRYIVPIFLGTYVLIVNILLFNLLIAKFSSAVTNAENESKELWSYQRAMMLREFTETILPFPFTLLTFLLWLIRQPHDPFSTGPEPGSSKKADPQIGSSQQDSSQGSKPNQEQGTIHGQDDVQNQEGSSQPDFSQGSRPNPEQGTIYGQDDVQNQEPGTPSPGILDWILRPVKSWKRGRRRSSIQVTETTLD